MGWNDVYVLEAESFAGWEVETGPRQTPVLGLTY
jgi:hypothetical protein